MSGRKIEFTTIKYQIPSTVLAGSLAHLDDDAIRGLLDEMSRALSERVDVNTVIWGLHMTAIYTAELARRGEQP